MTLTTHMLTITATAGSSLELDDQAGSQLRGALLGGLWRFCANPQMTSCAPCPLLNVCPVAALVAPMREAGETGGDQRSRPYVTRPPVGRRYAAGETLTLGVTLFGPAAHLFPYVAQAALMLESHGLGRPLRENQGQRGRVQVEQIAAVHPLHGSTQTLFARGVRQVQAPGLPITPADVAAFAADLPQDRLHIRLRTPLRLIDQNQLVRRFAVLPFLQRLGWRLDELWRTYGDPAQPRDSRALLAAAGALHVADDQTRWVDVVSYSRRTGTRTPIGGLIGDVTLTGELAPLRELLVWGSLIHVGKNVVKGDGWYEIGCR